MRSNKELRLEIERGLDAGQSKVAIYASLLDEYEKATALGILAQTSTRDLQQKYRIANNTLIGLLVCITAIKIIVAMPLLLSINPAASALLILLLPALNLFLIWGVANHKAAVYLFAACLSLSALGNVVDAFGKSRTPLIITLNIASLVMVVAIIFLAIFLMRKLFPNTTFFLQPKRGANEQPLL